MLWFGLAVGSVFTFVFVFIALAFVRTTKDQSWMVEEREFRRTLINQWNQTTVDIAERNRALWALVEKKQWK